ncbi:uncharacterized protein LOC115624500 [Scaptodrosophila lebanonensis]|uniref:Uncharacterized protein LOC115624500 n=1 Tax=Drosophila lebanonensis TaxID=7225 RepID=A0A6J2TGD9_DROLE|nr:uncharacterized protein LOC115624500 [Scaptodrosophila lebanonensis]
MQEIENTIVDVFDPLLKIILEGQSKSLKEHVYSNKAQCKDSNKPLNANPEIGAKPVTNEGSTTIQICKRNEKCVPRTNCVNGVINEYGEGLIDFRQSEICDSSAMKKCCTIPKQ